MKLYAEATTFDEDALDNEFNKKRQNFTSQPVPPYSIGDLWTQGGSGDIMVCRVSRTYGEFTASDWEKASKYTDDSALSDWLSGDYADDMEGIREQIDSKAETWYQSERPDITESWTAEEKQKHIGDLWYNTTANTTWRYDGTTWVQQNVPTAVFDAIDGKASIFTSNTQPSSASEGDLWFKSASDPIKTYVNGSWVEYNKYTDDSALNAFKNGDYAAFVTNTQTGIAGANALASSKITTYYQNDPPSGTSTGDLWIDTNDNNKLYRYNGSAWVSIRDSGIQEALTAASTAQSTADGKIVTFADADQPSEASIGDLWIDTDNDNELYRYDGSDWVSVRDGTIAEAAAKVNNYIAELNDDGIFVHEQDQSASPSTGTGVHISDDVAIVKNGVRRNVLDDDGMTVKDKDGNDVAKFGREVTIGSSTGSSDTFHQIKVNNTSVDFIENGSTIAYVSEDKGYFTNMEINDALYLKDYALRQDNTGKLVIGRRR